MMWLWIIIGIIVLVFLFSLFSGESAGDSAGNAAMAGVQAGGCMLQVFIWGLGIAVMLMIFGFLFG
jgi:hypothetical protein